MATHTIPAPRPTTLRRQVLTLGLPAVGEQFLNMLVGLTDTYLVGHITLAAAAQLGYGSAEALAGVGVGANIMFVVTSIILAGAIGSTALIARATGAKQSDEVDQAVEQSVLLGIALGVLGLILLYPLAPQAMALLGAGPEIAPLGVEFLRIVALSMPLTGVLFLCNGALRGAGDTRTPLLIMLLINSINIVGSWLLVNGQFGLPALGVAGAAWGTTISRCLGGIVVIAVLVRGRGLLKLTRWPRFDFGITRRIVHIGLPTAAEMLVFQGAIVFFARYIVGLGTIAYAAHTAVVTTHSISFLPGFGFAVAATTLVGQSLGAQDVQRARRSGHEAFAQAALFMGVMGVLFALFPGWFLSLLVDDPQVVATATPALRIVGLVQPLLAGSFVYAGALRGAGDTRWPLLSKLISPWLVRLPIAFLLLPWLGLTGAWIALSADFVFQALLVWWRFRGNRWERIKV
jgi:multidrug resistance protein, MATE family